MHGGSKTTSTGGKDAEFGSSPHGKGKDSKMGKSVSQPKFNLSRMPEGPQLSSSVLSADLHAPYVYGDRMYDRQSASTLLHSINSYSMPKARRFTDGQRETFNNGGVTLKSTLDPKGRDFSHVSARKPMDHLLGNAQPGPGQYDLKSEFGKVWFDKESKKFEADKVDKKGKTFALGLEAYQNSFTLGMNKNIPAESELKSKPGPGTYELPPTFGKLGKSAKLAFKLHEKFVSFSPGPVYEPNFKPVEQARYQTQSMGYGGRYDFTRATQGMPGPEYNIPSKFDKYKNPREEELIQKAKLRSKQLLEKRAQREQQLPELEPARHLSTYN